MEIFVQKEEKMEKFKYKWNAQTKQDEKREK